MLLVNSLALLLLCQAGYQIGRAAPQQQQQQQQPQTPPVHQAETSDSNASAAGNASPAPPSSPRDAANATGVANQLMPLLDTNFELSDYTPAHLAEIQFDGISRTDDDRRASAIVNQHHNETQLYEFLKQLASSYPSVTRLYSIGESVEKRKLWVLEISENPGEHVRLKPEFRYIANIHGNEVVGRELLLNLAKLILENYHATEGLEDALRPTGRKFIKRLVRTTRIHLLVSMNPDGYSVSDVACMYQKPSQVGRLNANRVDLNRNFPDEGLGAARPDAATQPEVRAVMDWSRSEPFVLSASLHGGALVMNIPYDASTNRTLNRDPNRRTPDHELFQSVASAYANYHPTMHTGRMCYDKCTDYHNETFEDTHGITVGAAWYSLYGGMQDWMYNNTNDFQTTIELGCNQYPPAEALHQYWEFNKAPLLNYMRQVHRGIKGTIQDALTGKYLANVVVHVADIDHNITSTKYGDYFRLLAEGHYFVHFVHPAYHSEKISVQLGNGMAQIHNITLKPLKAADGSALEQVSDWLDTNRADKEEGDDKGAKNRGRNEDHSLVMATLVMSVLTVVLLLSLVGAYVIQKQRYRRSQSVSVELQPRSSSTGVSLPKQAASSHHQLSTSTVNTNISA